MTDDVWITKHDEHLDLTYSLSLKHILIVNILN